ncbi:MAG: hypothetical protein HC880_09410 [Bacteroidia bacterium]|nr:hypothetical protein [Bacteroidia bacterium]
MKATERYITAVEGHAEKSIIKYAYKKGFKVIRIAASRDICNKCANYIYEVGAEPASDLEMQEVWKHIWKHLIK